MFISLPGIESEVDKLIALGNFEGALANMVVGVHNHHKAPDLAHQFLYYPKFDRQIEQLAAALKAQATPNEVSAPRAASGNTLIIATELYQVGGHSRVVEDFARELDSPTIVLTDLFSRYRNDQNMLNWILDGFSHTPVVYLPQRSLWAKCRALLELTNRLQPSSIFYFNHHQDPIPFVATLGHDGAKKAFVHHADHHPSLGVTFPGVTHVDLTDERAVTCARELQQQVKLLRLYVPDLGLKQFSPVAGSALSVVTSGTQVKFARSGPLALQEIAKAVLETTTGNFFHIGPIEADWVDEIRAHLQGAQIDPARFVSGGAVKSLWQSLAGLDAHLYLGSAPVGGGRAAIEAQGCGYPLAFYRVPDPTSLVAGDSFYANKDLAWATLSELRSLLSSIGPQLTGLSRQARAFYEQDFSRQDFVRVLASITGA